MTVLRILALLILTAFSHSVYAQSCTANACIGAAKQASNVGRQISYDIRLENLGAINLTSLSVPDDLDAAFGAGNYALLTGPTVTAGASTVVANSGFDGSTDTQLVDPGSTLASGQQATVSFTVEISSITDQGLGIGIYTNQVTATADASGDTTSDLSDDGVDPDPNANQDPTDVGEDDPSVINILANPLIGAAKNAQVMGSEVTFELVLENFGNVTLELLSATDDLDSVFGAGNYLITGTPILVDDPGTILLNGSFNGSSNTDLLSPASTLPVNDTASIQFIVDVTNPVDQGLGIGVYTNQVTAVASSSAQTRTDLSTEGSDPDPDGNSTPSESRPTAVVLGEEPQIGLAKTASVNGNVVTFDLYLENLGNVTLSQLSLIDDLNATLGAGNFFVSSDPALVDDPGSLVINSGFDGNMDTGLIGSGDLTAGDTARIQFEVTVVSLADLGLGLGVFENQASIQGFAPGGGFTMDVSDDGTDPDPNGNGDPTDAGEDDPSAFSVSPAPRLGLAKQYISGGTSSGIPFVTLQFTLTNYGNQQISNITISDDLNAVYGAGNFVHLTDPMFVNGSPTLTYNSAFNGNSNTTMVSGGSLDPGESVTFRIEHRVISIIDQGFGFGIYQNQVTVNGTDPGANPVSDLSHEGANPDPNGDGDPSEMDPTVINVNELGVIGAAKDVSVTGNQITFNLTLENLGNLEVQQIGVVENLDNVFGAGNYVLSSPPAFVDDPGTIVLNTAFDGSSERELLDILAGSALTVGDTATIRYVVDVVNVTNQGLGLGNYSTQNAVTGFDVNGAATSDDSDFGTDPDPNGNGNPNEAGENDATTYSIAVDSPIGIANEALVSGFDVTLNMYLENLGSGGLSAVQLTNNLNDAFGAGNYTITGLPMMIVDPGTLTLNNNFDGSGDNQILDSSSTLAAGATAQIQLAVRVDTETDQGNGFGIYTNQTVASGTQANGIVVSDLSDDGTDPDPNGNNEPGEAGEDDATSIVIAGNPAIGIAKQATVNGTQVTFDFYIENLGDVTVSNVIMQDPLNPVFGSGNYSVATQPSLVAGADTLTTNSQFFGFSVFDFVLAGGFLRPGETAQVRVVINVTNVTDQGSGLGVYSNSVTINGNGPDGTPVSDLSDEGTDPDPNGNADAGDTGEGDATFIIIGDEAVIGIAKQATTAGQQVTFDLYLENLRTSTLSDLSLTENLDDVFGAGNYAINGAPSLVDDPGTLTLNGAFDGSADTQLLVPGSSTLAGTTTAQIQLVVDVTNVVDQGQGLGAYSNQVEVSGMAPLGSMYIDLSDAGTDPDPNGNGFPNDADESDPTTFSVGITQVGAAKNAAVSGRQVTLDYYIENLGSTVFSAVSLPDDLDAVFGAGNYRIVAGPTQISAPRDLVINSGFNGSSDTQLVASGGLGLGVTEQIQLVVEVDRLIDGGSGLGVYSNQVTVTADASSDLSDAGTDPDPNGNSDATEAGENDPTNFTLAQDPLVGVAKTALATGRVVTVDLYLEGFGNVEPTGLSLLEDLDATFGSGNYALVSSPSLIVDPGTLSLNTAYDGSAQPDILTAGSTLLAGVTAQIRMSVNVGNVTDQGFGLGNYFNQAEAIATAPDASSASDLSDQGSDPDANGSGRPDDSDEDDPTSIVLQANIGDFVWNDVNGDGVQDMGEDGIPGVSVFIDLNSNGALDGGEPVSMTDAGGIYGFFNLSAATYQIGVDDSTLPEGFALTGGTEPVSVTVFAGEDSTNVDFGYQQQNASIGDRVFNDLNGDGTADPGEPGISGVTLFLDLNANSILDGAEPVDITDGDGEYDLAALPAGSYSVVLDETTLAPGFFLTSGSTPLAVNLADGEDFNTADFGYQQRNASIGGLIFDDLNGDGMFNVGEPGLDGVEVFADLNLSGVADQGEPSDTTVGGDYQLAGLAAGTYSLVVDLSTLPSGYVLTSGTLPLAVNLAAGEEVNDADLGFFDQVTGVREFRLTKTYQDNPVQQGRTVIVEYLVRNTLDTGATQIGFTDDLGASLPGLTSLNLPLFDVCGQGSSLSGTDVISLADGSLGSGQLCRFEVELQVPSTAAPDDYPGTTGALSSTQFAGNSASDTLTVVVNSLDVSVTITNNRSVVADQDVIDYLVSVVNEDSVSGVEGVTVDLPLPAAVIAATWDCMPSAGASCSASGTGAINDVVNLPIGGSAVYSWSGSLPQLSDTTLDVAVTIQAPAGLTDVVPGNNTANDLDSVVSQILFRSSFEANEGVVFKLAAGKAEVSTTMLMALGIMPGELLTVEDQQSQPVYRVQGRRQLDGQIQYRFLWFNTGAWSVGGWQDLQSSTKLQLTWDPDGPTVER